MPIDEQQKSTLTTNVSNVIRGSPVKVDVQRFALAFRTLLDRTKGDVVELEPIAQYLVAQGLSEKEALELCVVIWSKKLGVQFGLPARVQMLSQDAIDHIVEQHADKRAGAVTWDKKEPEKPRAPTTPYEPEDGRTPADPGRRTKILGAIAAVGIVVAVGFNAWLSASETPIVSVDPPPDGLPCTEIKTNMKVAICTIPLAFWTQTPRETVEAKLTITKGALKARGVNEVWVRTSENHKVVMVK